MRQSAREFVFFFLGGDTKLTCCSAGKGGRWAATGRRMLCARTGRDVASIRGMGKFIQKPGGSRRMLRVWFQIYLINSELKRSSCSSFMLKLTEFISRLQYGIYNFDSLEAISLVGHSEKGSRCETYTGAGCRLLEPAARTTITFLARDCGQELYDSVVYRQHIVEI